MPPVGLVAGLICLAARAWKYRQGTRRKGRGEVERRDANQRGRGGEGENIELGEMKRRNRGSEGSSIYGDDRT
jgi:hypothetical protein